MSVGGVTKISRSSTAVEFLTLLACSIKTDNIIRLTITILSVVDVWTDIQANLVLIRSVWGKYVGIHTTCLRTTESFAALVSERRVLADAGVVFDISSG